MGVAVGGTAYNAAVIFVPLGGFIGWLIGNRPPASDNQAVQRPDDVLSEAEKGRFEAAKDDTKPDNAFVALISSSLAITAALWNFHIDLLDTLGLFPVFARSPWLFVMLCVVISIFFPPFLVVYFAAYVGALHHGMSEKTAYRAVLS